MNDTNALRETAVVMHDRFVAEVLSARLGFDNMGALRLTLRLKTGRDSEFMRDSPILGPCHPGAVAAASGIEWIARTLDVFGAESVGALKGKLAWVLYARDAAPGTVAGFESLRPGSDVRFLYADWERQYVKKPMRERLHLEDAAKTHKACREKGEPERAEVITPEMVRAATCRIGEVDATLYIVDVTYHRRVHVVTKTGSLAKATEMALSQVEEDIIEGFGVHRGELSVTSARPASEEKDHCPVARYFVVDEEVPEKTDEGDAFAHNVDSWFAFRRRLANDGE